MDQRDKIIAGCNGIPLKNLANYVRNEVVPLEDLKKHLKPEKYDQLVLLLATEEEAFWEDVKRANSVKIYQKYLKCYPNGRHSEEAKTILLSLEDEYWKEICRDLTKEGLEEYLSTFPDGKHVEECKILLADLPYLEVKKKDTIAAYREYMAKYPGKHTEEILKRIEEIEDELDWRTACDNNSKYSYRVYLEKHPNGIHAVEAKERGNNRTKTEIFIENLKKDPNCYPISGPDGIKTQIENGVATWENLSEVFDESKIEAIKKWTEAKSLPIIKDIDRLPNGFTEVYFWGTKGTGKTCVIGSVIGSLRNIKQTYVNHRSKYADAQMYIDNLTNLFNENNKICTLPDSTITTNLPAMTFGIKDAEEREHLLMLIDMAGEAFTGIYKSRHNIGMTEDEKKAVQKIDRYLMGKQRNAKIHFFVVEYGGADKIVDPSSLPGITQINILQDVAAYFQEKDIFKESTVGVYVVVTKCDKIDCTREERAERADEYVSTGQMGNFVKNLKEYAAQARVKEFKKISFSIGDVFAKSLCVFDDRDTEKIIEKLLLKTNWVTGEKKWEKIYGWLSYR